MERCNLPFGGLPSVWIGFPKSAGTWEPAAETCVAGLRPTRQRDPDFHESQLRATGPASGPFFAQRNGGKNGSASGVCDDQHGVMDPRNRGNRQAAQVAISIAMLRMFSALLAGANGMPTARFLLFNVAGGICWACLFGFGAFTLGAEIYKISETLSVISWAYLLRRDMRSQFRSTK
jgi:hypothetical protein